VAEVCELIDEASRSVTYYKLSEHHPRLERASVRGGDDGYEARRADATNRFLPLLEQHATS